MICFFFRAMVLPHSVVHSFIVWLNVLSGAFSQRNALNACNEFTNLPNDKLTQAPANRNRAVIFPAELVSKV